MYACMHTIYTRKNCTVEVEGKPIKELQVKCESEKNTRGRSRIS